MKIHCGIPVSILIFIVFLLTNLISLRASNQIDYQKSIHQVEWEKYHKLDKINQGIPDVISGRPMDLISKEIPPTREVFGYLPYWTYSNYPYLNYNLLTTIAYFGVDIDEYGNITNYHHWPAAGLINEAHSHGVRVVLTVILFDPTKLGNLLNDPVRRTRLVNNLLTQVQNANADGVTIDFERVPSSAKVNLTNFMSELTTAFHNNIPGSFVTIFSPAVDWSNAWEYDNLAQITDGLIMQGYDYHWRTSPNAGPTAPLTGGSIWGTYNVTWTINDYLSKTLQNSGKLILSVPFFGFEWNTADGQLNSPALAPGTAIFYNSAYPNAQIHGRLWDQESQTPWYRYTSGSLWYQGWYDDSLSLGLKFSLVNQLNLKGVAIWALSYDGQRTELQEAITDAFGSNAAPFKPERFRIVNLGGGAVKIAVSPSGGATAYRLYRSSDGDVFDEGTDFSNPDIVLSNLSQDSIIYIKMAAANGNGESAPTEVLAVKPLNSLADILIVNGFDRISGTINTFDFIRRFAPSLVRFYRSFDSCSNEAVSEGDVLLQDYNVVIWISGEEGTSDESFSMVEQVLLASYLEAGGKLFLSGSEIGYDLAGQGSSADQLFYRTYLKADYVMDRVPTYNMDGISQTVFNSLTAISFDNGTYGTYNVDYPDGIRPVDGSVACLNYSGFAPETYGYAGIQYEGNFGNGTTPGKLVYLGIPFETIYPENMRDSILTRIFQFFDISSDISIVDPVLPQKVELSQNYPNPFNPTTTIKFTISGGQTVHVKLTVYDLLGHEIAILLDEMKGSGIYEVKWDGKNSRGKAVPSGIYIYRLQAGRETISQKMTLIR